MESTKYIGMDVQKEATTIAVMKPAGKLVMESIVESKAAAIAQTLERLRGGLYVTLEEGTWAAWLYDLLKPRATKVVVCTPRKKASVRGRCRSSQLTVVRVNNKALRRNPMVFVPTRPWKSPSITTWADYPNQNLPTVSAEDAKCY